MRAIVLKIKKLGTFERSFEKRSGKLSPKNTISTGYIIRHNHVHFALDVSGIGN